MFLVAAPAAMMMSGFHFTICSILTALSSFEASAEGSWSPTFWPPAVSIVEPKTVFLPGMFVVLPFFPVYMTLGCCVAFADASCTD